MARRASAGGTSSPPYSTGQVGTTRPDAANVGYQASYSAHGCAPRGSPPRRRARRPSRHAAGTCVVDPAPHVRSAASSGGGAAVDVEPAAHRPVNSGSRFSTKAPRPSRKSSLRLDSSRAKASSRRCCVERCARADVCSSHLVSPSATVGPAASCGGQRLGRRRRPRPAGTARWTEPPLGRLGAVEPAAEQQQLAGPRPGRRSRGSSQVPPLSGVKPRWLNGSHTWRRRRRR